MNNADKIKALLEQPSIASLHLLDSGGGHLITFVRSDLLWIDNDFIQSLSHTSERIEWHEWPEISEGDLVMTPDGDGKVEFVGNENYGYLVRSTDWKLPYMRHEIALLQKAGES